MTTYLRNFLLAVLCLSFISACSKDDNPANGGGGNTDGSFTINGAGINNQTYNTLDRPAGAPYNPFAFGFFSPTDSATAIFNSGNSSGNSASVSIVYLGNQTGNFQNASVQRVILVTVGERGFAGGFESESPGSPIIPNTTFNLNVTRYEAAGGRIQGSYSGTLREVGDKGFGSATLTITGNFNVQRLEDGFEDERTIDLLRYKQMSVR